MITSIPPVPFDAPAVERGVGFFETVLVSDRRAVLWEAHEQRLLGTLTLLGLPAPTPEVLWRQARAVLLDLAGGEWGLRLSWIAVGSDIELPSSWRLDVSARAIPPTTLARRGGSHAVTLPPELCRDSPGLKSTSYMGAILGLRHARRQGGDEGLFTAPDGHYLEGTSTSLVTWDLDGPAAAASGTLPSVTAKRFLEGHDVTRKAIRKSDILAGALLCGSLTTVVPILSIDGQTCEQPLAMLVAARELSERLLHDRSLSRGPE